MNENNELTLEECSQKIFNLMYGKHKRNILQAYSDVLDKYKIDYTYEEVKDYLFHHDLHKTDE